MINISISLKNPVWIRVLTLNQHTVYWSFMVFVSPSVNSYLVIISIAIFSTLQKMNNRNYVLLSPYEITSFSYLLFHVYSASTLKLDLDVKTLKSSMVTVAGEFNLLSRLEISCTLFSWRDRFCEDEFDYYVNSPWKYSSGSSHYSNSVSVVP